MKRYFDVCTKEIYTSQGQEKTKWHNVGKLMELDNGGFMLNIPLLPKLYVFPQKEKNEAHKVAAQATAGGFPEEDGKIPF